MRAASSALRPLHAKARLKENSASRQLVTSCHLIAMGAVRGTAKADIMKNEERQG
jgi:hypothetical protein